jgi:hypothetical protein
MIVLTYILAFLMVSAVILCVMLIVGRHRRNAIENAKAERIREANRPVRVWVCRYCGFMSEMSEEVCSGCASPRPEEFIYRIVPAKDLTAQVRPGRGEESGKTLVVR